MTKRIYKQSDTIDNLRNLEISECFKYIYSWLKDETIKQVDYHEYLNGPASDIMISKAEDKLRHKLPKDLVKTLKIFNGTHTYIGFIHGNKFFNLDEIVRSYAGLSKIKKGYIDYLPFAGLEDPDFKSKTYDFLAINLKTLKIHFLSDTNGNKVEYVTNNNLREMWNELVYDLDVGNGIMTEQLCEPIFDM